MIDDFSSLSIYIDKKGIWKEIMAGNKSIFSKFLEEYDSLISSIVYARAIIIIGEELLSMVT